MIALWMLAAVAIAAALGTAAAAAERVARLWRRPARYAWSLALLGAVAAPGVAALLPAAAVTGTPAPAAEPAPEPAGIVSLATVVVRADGLLSRLGNQLAPLDRPLIAAWLGLSALAFAVVFRGAVGLARARRGWRRHVLDGTPVLLAGDVGPAVVGLRRPAIVLPDWALSLDASLRAMVVRHEAEHVRARDPLALALGALAVVLMPWNAAVWWQLRRLRVALEIDCDARVLAAHGDVTRYGLLLLAVAQRRATASPWRALSGVPALAESTSDLSRRIDAMRTSTPRRRAVRTALGTLAGSLAVVGAFAACSAASDVTGSERRARDESLGPAARGAIEREYAVQREIHASLVRSRDRASAAGDAGDVATLGGQIATQARRVAEARRRLVAVGALPATVAEGPAMLPAGDGTLRVGEAPAGLASVITSAITPARRADAPARAPLPMRPTRVDGPYFEFQVEKPVTPAPGNVGPRYPQELRQAGVEGTVLAQFVVDVTGRVEPGSFKVLRSDHDLFTNAVRSALENMKLLPAEVGGRPVKQLVQQPFQFQLTK